jgi:flagellar biosynthesis GTPase FlhF
MKIKTFYTKTMPEALREVKSHFGPEALILSTREIRRRSGVWGSASGFEVVAAIDDSDKFDSFSPSERGSAIEAAREKKFPAVILRVAGIYGPDRGHWFKQFLRRSRESIKKEPRCFW